MEAKTFYSVTSVVFSIVTAMHLWRSLAGWDLVLNGWTVPIWFSYLGVLFAGYLAYSAWNLKMGK